MKAEDVKRAMEKIDVVFARVVVGDKLSRVFTVPKAELAKMVDELKPETELDVFVSWNECYLLVGVSWNECYLLVGK